MSRRPSLWNPASRLGATRTSGNEVDLRKEFDILIYGDESNIPHGKLAVIRNIQYNEQLEPVICSCIDSSTREPSGTCPYCHGMGKLWTEKWCMTYSMYSGTDGGLSNRIRYTWPGQIRTDWKIFFLRYDTLIRYDDKIVEMKLDTEGKPVIPYKRESIYSPQTIVPYRSDYGRIEYLAVYCQEEDAIRPDNF